MKRSILVLFAIASILTPSTVNATLQCVASQTCSGSSQFCIKIADATSWSCPSGTTTGCDNGMTQGTAKAYADKKFCCKAATTSSPPTSTECLTTNVRWCGGTAGDGGSSCNYNYCFRNKGSDGNGKTVCPSAETKNDACKDITEDQERLIEGTKYCCKKAECPGDSTTRLTTEAATTTAATTTAASNPSSNKNKESGAGGMEHKMAGLLATTTTALLLSNTLNP